MQMPFTTAKALGKVTFISQKIAPGWVIAQGYSGRAPHLEVAPHLDADVLRRSKGLGRGDPAHQQAADHGEVKGVEGGLVGHDAQVGRLSVLGQVNSANGRGGDVQQLPVRGLVRRLRTVTHF